MKPIDVIKQHVRRVMRQVARALNHITGGRVTPAQVTWIGLIGHIPVAILIAGNHYLLGACWLVVFGLFDAVDGELARLQGSASVRGMLLDASTDRMKETMLYTAVAYSLILGNQPLWAAMAVLACGASLTVSYVKAKGEAAVASGSQKIPHATLNRMFSDGILTFETRMFVLVVGLLSAQLSVAVTIIAVLATITAFQRLVRIGRQL